MTSPCTSCTDATTPCPCPTYLRWWGQTHPEPPQSEPCATCEDAEWLALAGEAPEQIAARLGMRWDSLVNHLRKHGRDLRRSA